MTTSDGYLLCFYLNKLCVLCCVLLFLLFMSLYVMLVTTKFSEKKGNHKKNNRKEIPNWWIEVRGYSKNDK